MADQSDMKDNVSKLTLWYLRWAAKQWLEEHPNALHSPAVRKAVIASFQAARLPEEPFPNHQKADT